MKEASADKIVGLLQDRLDSLSDLGVMPTHVHWNAIRPDFIAVHTMLDPQVDAGVMVDETAERVAALCGTPGALARRRDWDDLSIGRAGTVEYLGALDGWAMAGGWSSFTVWPGISGPGRQIAADRADTERSASVRTSR